MVITQDMIADKVTPVKWHGGYFSMVCPFHDDREPSLLVYRDGGYCMGCRRSYSLNAIWYKIKRRTSYRNNAEPEKRGALNWALAPEAEELAEEAHAILESYPAQMTYIRQRGIERRLEPNRLGWWDGFYTFPGYKENFEFQGLIIRASPEIQAFSGIRYLTPPGQEPFLYVPDWRKVKSDSRVFVTFGIIDALCIADLGFAVCSPSNGQTDDGRLLDTIRREIVVVPDKNAEEVETAYRLMANLGWRGRVLRLDYPDGMKDPADMHKTQFTRARLLSQLGNV